MKSFLDIITSVEVLKETAEEKPDILNIRPDFDFGNSKPKDWNRDEINFELLQGGWKGGLKHWSAEDLQLYLEKYKKDLAKASGRKASDALIKRVSEISKNSKKTSNSNLEVKPNKEEVSTTMIIDGLSTQKNREDRIWAKSAIDKTIDKVYPVRNNPWIGSENNKESSSNLIKTAQGISPKKEKLSLKDIESAQRYLFYLCKPVLYNRYWKYLGPYREKAYEIGKGPESFLGIAWEALTKKPSYLKRKVPMDINGYTYKVDPVTLEQLLKIDPEEVENIDISKITYKHGALSYFNIDKVSLGADLISSFASVFNLFVMSGSIKENNPNPKGVSLEGLESQGKKDDKDYNKTDAKAAEDYLSKEIANINTYTNWENFLDENPSLFENKNGKIPAERFIQMIKLVALEGAESESFKKEYLEEIYLLYPLLKNDVPILTDWENGACQEYIDSLKGRMKTKISEGQTPRNIQQSKEKKGEEVFLRLFESLLKESKIKKINETIWRPIDFSVSLKFSNLVWIDMMYIWLRNKTIYPQKSFPRDTIEVRNRSRTPIDKRIDIETGKLSNYFVLLGYKSTTAFSLMTQIFHKLYIDIVRQTKDKSGTLSPEDYDNISVETAKKLMNLIDEYKKKDPSDIEQPLGTSIQMKRSKQFIEDDSQVLWNLWKSS
jgi:hypothetical protein